MMEEIEAIRAILDEQDNAWRGDAMAFARSAASDIVFTNVMGVFSIGHAPFEAQHRYIFATFYKGSFLRQRLERTSFVRPEVVVVNTLSEVTNFGALPPFLQAQAQDGVLMTRLEQVLVRREERWQVATFHNVVVHPQAATTAPSP